MGDEHDDRRRALRISINEEFARLPEATFISDLSEYGVFVQTRQPPDIGRMVRLRFTVLLDDPVVVEAQGKVVRHSRDPRGMGIEFTDLAPETILRINDIVARQQPRESGPPVTEAGETFDGAQTQAKGQIPIRAEVRRRTKKRDEDVDDRATSRYPAVNASASSSGSDILGSGEYELVDDDDGEDGA